MACYRGCRYCRGCRGGCRSCACRGGSCYGGGRSCCGRCYGGNCYSCGRYRCRSYEAAELEIEQVVNTGPGGLINADDGFNFAMEDDKVVLKVTNIDTLITENTKAHHTDEYDITEPDNKERDLVIRRGQAFNIEVTVNRDYNHQSDDLRLMFDVGENPIPSKGTRVDIMLSDRDDPHQWGAKLKSVHGKKIVLTIFTPPNCIVGKWSIGIDNRHCVNNESGGACFRYRHDRPIYIIFNPWCTEDAVYMSPADDREEYVMNEVGKIYVGSKKNISGRVWNYGQFDSSVLDCVMTILEGSSLQPQARGDVVKVVRKLTGLVNATTNDGIIEGNWSGEYEGGKAPLKWSGSPAILKEFTKTENAVKYGQCWVFSGVLTTLCRTLGIPARSVTVFDAAHDCDASCTSVDTYFNEKGESIEDLNDDCIWNFHVWNEAFMARRDLPEGYGGWQVMDPTPQETSEGVTTCGPASRVAVKNGEVGYSHDTSMLFCELNCDCCSWCKNCCGTWNKSCKKDTCGKFISTKKKGELKGGLTCTKGKDDCDREDITNEYKHADGSEGARAACETAKKSTSTTCCCCCGGKMCECGKDEICFNFRELETIELGKPFEVHLRACNNADKTRKVSVLLKALSCSYAGGQCTLINSSMIEKDIAPKQCQEFKFQVTPEEYIDKLLEHGLIRMCAWAKVEGTNQVFVECDDFKIVKPELAVTAGKAPKVGETWDVSFSFRNPLNETLKNCKLILEGPGIQDELTLDVPNVGPKEVFTKKMELVPKKPSIGNKARCLCAKFSSLQIDDIDGYVCLRVAEAAKKHGQVKM